MRLIKLVFLIFMIGFLSIAAAHATPYCYKLSAQSNAKSTLKVVITSINERPKTIIANLTPTNQVKSIGRFCSRGAADISTTAEVSQTQQPRCKITLNNSGHILTKNCSNGLYMIKMSNPKAIVFILR